VVEVGTHRITVQALGKPREPTREVPKTQVELMPTEIPASLAQLQLENIRRETPKAPKRWRVAQPGQKIPLEKIVQHANDEKSAENRIV
jgi:hypothetical protein